MVWVLEGNHGLGKCKDKNCSIVEELKIAGTCMDLSSH